MRSPYCSPYRDAIEKSELGCAMCATTDESVPNWRPHQSINETRDACGSLGVRPDIRVSDWTL